jgi:hypothetical protein
MKNLFVFSVLLSLGTAQAAKLSNNLFGEWRENCIKALDVEGKDETAPFVMYKMVVGFDGKIEHNYSYYTDNKCTKRKSQKREWSTYKVLKSKSREAKLMVRKDLEGGMVSESIVELRLPSINRMSSKVLSTNIVFDDMLSPDSLDGVGKNAGSGEQPKNLSRYIEEPKPMDQPKPAEKPKASL